MSTDQPGRGDASGEVEALAEVHVIDRDGMIWRIVRDGGMATRAHQTGIVSIGINTLEREHGPLVTLAAYVAVEQDRAVREAEAKALAPDLRRRLIAAADRPLRVRRNILLLAAHASGHMKHPHGDSCEECKERWPCVAVRRAASPSLDAFADCDLDMGLPAALAAYVDAERDRAVREALGPVRALADDLWRVTPCGCGHRADLHSNPVYPGDVAVCHGGLGLCGCEWSFTGIVQSRLRAALPDEAGEGS